MTRAAVLAGLAVLVWPAAARLRWAAPVGREGRQALLPRAWVRRPGPGRRGDGDWVADFAEVVAVGLDAGLDLSSAALASARAPTVVLCAPWLSGRLEASLAEGAGVAMALGGPADASDANRRDLALVVAAWRLSEEVGASAAATTVAAAHAVRGRRAARERTAAVVAGPRASMWLLTFLPLVGPAAGALVGVGPASLYGSAVAALAACVGLVLTATGWWWARALLRRAAQPRLTHTGPP